MSSVTAVVVCNDSEATCRRDSCESLIALVMFSQAMKYLDDTEYIALGTPVCSANYVLVGRLNLKRPGLHAVHSDTTSVMDNLILQDMIDLYYWPTPNGHKISIMLEECGLPYKTISVAIGDGDQFAPHDTGISVFEGGAILMYLAEKAGMLLPQDQADRYEVLQWLFWQAGGLGPMAGQLSHFVNYTKEEIPYAHKRYADEYDRLLAVMDVRLRDREYLAGEYSIADIASFPWVKPYRRFGNDLDKFENLRRWFDALKQRPAVRKGIDLGQDWKRSERKSDAARAIIFGQNAQTVFDAADAAEK